MKKHILLFLATCSITLITGCGQTAGPGTPSLSGNSKPTGRLPSPSNVQRNVQLQSSTMMLPAEDTAQ